MEQVIYKYEVPIGAHFTLDLPRGARPLAVQYQPATGKPQLWVQQIPTGEGLEARCFALRATGHAWTAAGPPAVESYVGTFQLLEGKFVFHLFEIYR